ncbi:MAG TPA: hypothetical protein VMD55_09070 [Terracidiphilus sp.]|nr:hypothetical protein [Terracidiphilus sp.]
MCRTITPRFANILIFGGGPLTRSDVKWFFLVVGIGLLVSTCWDTVDGLVKRFHGRDWPTVSAVIDIVNITFVEDPIARYALDSSH